MSFQLSGLLFQKSIPSFIPNARNTSLIPSNAHGSSSINQFLATHKSFIFSLLQNNTAQPVHNTTLTSKLTEKPISSLARKSVINQNNFNLHLSQQELLLWHCRLGHADFQQQAEGWDYFKTFSPVVQWLTVQLILIMTILLGLENQQIDHTTAFVQAPIDTDVYVEMSRLFSTPGKVCGLKQSPRN